MATSNDPIHEHVRANLFLPLAAAAPGAMARIILRKFLAAGGFDSVDDVTQSSEAVADELIKRLETVKLYEYTLSKYNKLQEEHATLVTDNAKLKEEHDKIAAENSRIKESYDACKENLISCHEVRPTDEDL